MQLTIQLHCTDSESFRNREFSFTLEDDIYVRYQSFESKEELEEGVRKAKPFKIDIGAIFSHRVREDRGVMISSTECSLVLSQKTIKRSFRPTSRQKRRNSCLILI